jgi:hypothetical protein
MLGSSLNRSDGNKMISCFTKHNTCLMCCFLFLFLNSGTFLLQVCQMDISSHLPASLLVQGATCRQWVCREFQAR